MIRFLLLFSLAVALEAKHCTFLPPAGWEIAQLKNPSPHVKIGFIGKGSGEFHPSINLAIEEVDVSLSEYVKAVKQLQSTDPQIQWRDLGKFPLKKGMGRLIEMASRSNLGETKILQLLFVENSTAYILTAALLKEDLPKFQTQILKAFESLAIAEDLGSFIEDDKKRSEFEATFRELGSSNQKDWEWQKLQALVGSHSFLGPYWQFLALQEGRAKIYRGESN